MHGAYPDGHVVILIRTLSNKDDTLVVVAAALFVSTRIVCVVSYSSVCISRFVVFFFVAILDRYLFGMECNVLLVATPKSNDSWCGYAQLLHCRFA